MALKIYPLVASGRHRRIRRRDPIDLSTRFARPIPKLKDPVQDFIERFEFPRAHFKPIDGVGFDKVGTLAVTANMAYTEVQGFTLPSGYEGILKFIGQGADAVGLFVDTTWRLRINGMSYVDWDGLALQRGTITVPTPVTIFLPDASTVSLQITNTTANTYTAQARISGWYWPKKDIRYSSME